jgi:signal transduction histidine kinase
MNLDAVTGWIGLPDPAGGERVFDPMGPAPDGAAVAETAQALGLGVADGQTAPVGAVTSAGLPGGAAGGQGLFTPFATGGGRRGWLLLVGPPDRGLPADAEAVLAPAGAFVGITLSRLAAVRQLRDANSDLERKVEERTAELRSEKESLADRVRERTRELEQAKRATVDAERRLLDRERTEGVHRLAAGLAHEVNNPIGAVRANLEYVADGLRRLGPGLDPAAKAEVEDLLSAVTDAARDSERVSASVRSLFGDAAASRRAAIKTPVAAAVRDALRAYEQATPGVPPPVLVEREGVFCGIPPGECARWLFRLLTVLAVGRRPVVRVEVDRCEDGPRLSMEVDQPFATGGEEAVSVLTREVEKAGGRLEVAATAKRTVARLVLPRAVGEDSKPPAPSAREVAR